MKLSLLLFAAFAVSFAALCAEDAKVAAEAVNALGVDLYRAHAAGEDNLLLSPYSIQSGLAMAYAGADGDTRAEMQRALHFPVDDNLLHDSFNALARQLTDLVADSVKNAQADQQARIPAKPLEFRLANRLYAQRGFDFLPPFLDLLKERYASTLGRIDYKQEPEKAREEINRWVEEQTQNRIQDVIGAGAIRPSTRLVLVNALYLRAPWPEWRVRQELFVVHGRDGVEVPTMVNQDRCGYAKGNGLQIVAFPYSEPGLQFVVAVPDNPRGLPALEAALTAKLLGEWADLPQRPVILHLPKFRIAPATLPLSEDLKALGMKTAFDEPPGSANFGRMAARLPDEYLGLTAVLRKTFLVVDEKGTEASAATGLEGVALDAPAPHVNPQVPIEVRVNRPFLFAVQHVASGAFLVLGRVTDPR